MLQAHHFEHSQVRPWWSQSFLAQYTTLVGHCGSGVFQVQVYKYKVSSVHSMAPGMDTCQLYADQYLEFLDADTCGLLSLVHR